MQANGMSNLLINEPPLQVLPSLAVLVGLEEAIILQQLHYWLLKSEAHQIDGAPWIYNSYKQWHDQFPFMSERVIGSAFRKLEEFGVVIAANHGSQSYDRTKWYTIDYDALSVLSSDALERSNVPNGTMEDTQTEQSSLAETTTETTTERTTRLTKSKIKEGQLLAIDSDGLAVPAEGPEWFKVCASVPGWDTTYEHADAWRSMANVSEDLAELKAYAIKDWFTAAMLKKGRNPYATWQNWARRDRDGTGAHPGINGRPSRPGVRTGSDFKGYG